jgi:hypothetical protein
VDPTLRKKREGWGTRRLVVYWHTHETNETAMKLCFALKIWLRLQPPGPLAVHFSISLPGLVSGRIPS